MLFGVNWISPTTLPIIRELINEGTINFCEIMVDNFVHLPSCEILKVLVDIPIGLHIVASRFLEKSPNELKALGDFLRPWIKDLNPLYVSDHLLEFSQAGRRLALINELDYEQNYTQVKERVLYWQSLLNTPLLFENHASLTHRGLHQVSFFKKLIKDTNARLLFDFSNAYVAEYNAAGKRCAWQPLLKQNKHFHVGGFKIDATSKLAIDTHDTSIDAQVLKDMQMFFRQDRAHRDKTLIIEFDAKVNVHVWRENILRIKQYIFANTSMQESSVMNILADHNREEKLSSLHYQNLHARIFKLAPNLLSLLPNNGHDMLHAFLNVATLRALKMDWTLHLHLLEWLKTHKSLQNYLTVSVIKELMIASVTRWSLSGLDHVDAKGIILSSPNLCDHAIGLWKSKLPHQTAKIVIMRFPNKDQQKNVYAISYQHGNWENLNWQMVE